MYRIFKYGKPLIPYRLRAWWAINTIGIYVTHLIIPSIVNVTITSQWIILFLKVVIVHNSIEGSIQYQSMRPRILYSSHIVIVIVCDSIFPPSSRYKKSQSYKLNLCWNSIEIAVLVIRIVYIQCAKYRVIESNSTIKKTI